MTEGVPRVDELFSRAVVAQLAEQRAQRETFAELERRLEALEHMVTDRLTDLSRLLRSGEVELRLELLEEEFAQRFSRLEGMLKSEVEGRLEAIREAVGDRLAQVDVAPQIAALEQELATRLAAVEGSMGESARSLADRITHFEQTFRADDLAPRLEALEHQLSTQLTAVEGLVGDGPQSLHAELLERLSALEGLVGSGELSVAQRLGLLEEKVVADDVSARLGALERQLEHRFGHLEEQVRGGETLERLRSLEMAVDERSSRLEEFVRTNDVEQRLDTLTQSVEHKLDDLKDDLRAGLPGPAAPVAHDGRELAALDEAVSYRLSRLEGSFHQLEGMIGAKLDAIAEASSAAEAGILERIIAESQVVGAHFHAVKPVVEALATAGPDLEAALAELRQLAENVRAPAEESTGYHGAPIGGDDGAEEDTVFLPPEETPIPDRRFGSILSRRDR